MLHFAHIDKHCDEISKRAKKDCCCFVSLQCSFWLVKGSSRPIAIAIVSCCYAVLFGICLLPMTDCFSKVRAILPCNREKKQHIIWVGSSMFQIPYIPLLLNSFTDLEEKYGHWQLSLVFILIFFILLCLRTLQMV